MTGSGGGTTGAGAADGAGVGVASAEGEGEASRLADGEGTGAGEATGALEGEVMAAVWDWCSCRYPTAPPAPKTMAATTPMTRLAPLLPIPGESLDDL